jgi:uncharacterized iron-regulated membrane protein
MPLALRMLLLKIHLCVGLASCVLLFLLGVTGALLVFDNQIDRLLNWSYEHVTPQARRLPLERLRQGVEQRYAGWRVATMDLSASSPNAAMAYSFVVLQGKERLQVFVDPYTGHVLGSRVKAAAFIEKLTQFHVNLLAGPRVMLLTTWGAVLLCVMAVSGIYLWLPRKITTVRASTSACRSNFDLHNAIGFYSFVFVLVFGFSAVVLHWGTALMPVAGWLTRSHPTEDPQVESSVMPQRSAPINLDEIYKIASTAVPDARVVRISIAARPKETDVVWLKYPEDRTPTGHTWLHIDQFSGRVLYERNSRTAAVAWRCVRLWNREIHTGDIFGWPSKIVAFCASLSVSLLSVTGPLIWWFKVRRSASE